MHPAVPPGFRLKANTLTAITAPDRTGLIDRALIRSAPKGNAKSAKYTSLAARAMLSGIPYCRFADFIIALIFILYHVFPHFARVFDKITKKSQLRVSPHNSRAFLQDSLLFLLYKYFNCTETKYKNCFLR